MADCGLLGMSQLVKENVMREGNTIKTIRKAVLNGSLPEIFKAADLRAIGVHRNTASTFLGKHCKGNPGRETVLFERVGQKGSG